MFTDPPLQRGPAVRVPAVRAARDRRSRASASGSHVRALDELVVARAGEDADRQQPAPRGSERARPGGDLARAEAALRAARALLLDAARSAFAIAAERGEVPQSRAGRRPARRTHAAPSPPRSPATAYRNGGGSAIYESSPLQRRFRDANVGDAAHARRAGDVGAHRAAAARRRDGHGAAVGPARRSASQPRTQSSGACSHEARSLVVARRERRGRDPAASERRGASRLRAAPPRSSTSAYGAAIPSEPKPNTRSGPEIAVACARPANRRRSRCARARLVGRERVHDPVKQRLLERVQDRRQRQLAPQPPHPQRDSQRRGRGARGASDELVTVVPVVRARRDHDVGRLASVTLRTSS